MLQYLMMVIETRRDRDETGASAVEYGLLVAGVAAAVILAVAAMSGILDGVFDGISSAINGGADDGTG